MLLDCGEGTLGQLTALFGGEGAVEVLIPNASSNPLPLAPNP